MSKQTSDCCYPDWNGSYITDKHKLDKDLFCIYCGWRPDYELRQKIREEMGKFPEGSIKLVAVYNEFIKADVPVTYVPRSMQSDHWTEEEKQEFLKTKEKRDD